MLLSGNSPAIAGGSDIALCCDLVYMAEELGRKHTVRERDLGTFDWTANRPINKA